MGQDNTVPRRINRVEGAAGEIIISGGPGVLETWGAPAAGIPSGLIAMWHGTIANIPAGWIICDGNNDTPNLLTRFVEGVATAATDPGATGGATAKTTGGHQHDLPFAQADDNLKWDLDEFGTGADISYTQSASGIPSSATSASAKAKTNTDGITDIRPLYYDVAFLMKT